MAHLGDASVGESQESEINPAQSGEAAGQSKGAAGGSEGRG